MSRSSLEIIIEAVDRASSQVNKVYDSVKRLGASQNHIQKLGQNMTQLGKTLSVGATLPVTAGLGLAVKSAMDFENSMAGVGKVYGQTETQAAGLARTIQDLSSTIPISASGLADIAAAGGQLGIPIKQSEEFTRTTAQMATAFDLIPAVAGQSIGKIKNIMGLTMDEVRSLGDTFNHLSNNSTASAADLIELTTRVGGTAKTFGLAENQMGALFATFSGVAKSPEIAATALGSMLPALQNVQKQSPKFQAAFESMGLDVNSFSQLLERDAMGGIQTFMNSLNQLDGASRQAALADMFGQGADADLIGNLANNPALLAENMALVADQSSFAGSMLSEFETASGTTSAQLQTLMNDVGNIAGNIGATMLPAIRSAVEFLKPMAQGLANFARENPGITKIAVGFLAVAAAIGPVLGIIGAVAGAIGGVVAAFSAGGLLAGVSTAVAVLAGMFAPVVAAALPVIGIIAAIAAAAYLIITNWGPISTFFSNLWAMLISDITRVSTGISNFVMGIINMGMTIMNSVAQFFGFQNALSMVGAAVMAAVQPFHLLKNLIMQVGPAALQAAMQMVQGFVSGGAQVVAAVTSMGSQVLGRIRAIAGQAFSAGAQIIQRLAAGIMSGVGAVTSAIGNVASAIKNALPGSPVKDGILRVLNNPATGPGAKISEMIAAGITAGAPAVQSAMGGLGSGIVGGGPTGSGGGQSIPATSPFAGGGGGVSIGSITFSFPGINSQEEAQAVGDDYEERLERTLERVLSNQNRIAYS